LSAAATKLRDPKARARAYKQVGIAQLELGKSSAAEQAFVFALTADALVDVDPVSDPPTAVALFRSTRDKLDGTLTVAANRREARVFVDGVDRGPTPFTGPLKVGRHQIRVATPDGHYERVMDNVVVGVGKTVALTIDLEARVGFLVVTGPVGHEVHVDGAPVGRTPLKRAAVAPGKRTVSVMRAGFETKIVEIEVEAGRESIVEGLLVKSAPAVVVATPATPPPPKTDPTTTATTTTTTLPTRTVTTFLPRRNTRPWAWVALGVTVVGLAIGSGLYFFSDVGDYSGTRADVTARSEEANTRIQIGAGVVFGSGLLGGGLTLALFLLHREAATPRVSIGLEVPMLSGGRVPGFSIAIHR
jgi:hypothetical protein